MDNRIVVLVPKKDKVPDEELIERLEQLLDEAKSGQLTSLAYAGTQYDMGVCYGWVSTDDREIHASGAIQYMVALWNKALVQNN